MSTRLGAERGGKRLDERLPLGGGRPVDRDDPRRTH